LELEDALAPTRITSVSNPENADQVIAGIGVGGLSLPIGTTISEMMRARK